MKATLEFTLPEEREDHELALYGWKWRRVVQEMFNVFNDLENDASMDKKTIAAIREAVVSDMLDYQLEV